MGMMVGVQSKGSACAGAYESGVQDHVGRCKTAGARKDRRNLTRAAEIGAYSMAIEDAYIFQIHEKGGLYFLSARCYYMPTTINILDLSQIVLNDIRLH
jgi:hypothetical protein